MITANIPPYALVYGVPARQHGWMCRCGERLAIEGAAAYCQACGRGYSAVGEGITEA